MKKSVLGIVCVLTLAMSSLAFAEAGPTKTEASPWVGVDAGLGIFTGGTSNTTKFTPGVTLGYKLPSMWSIMPGSGRRGRRL